jgi:hypothetical protein
VALVAEEKEEAAVRALVALVAQEKEEAVARAAVLTDAEAAVTEAAA